MRLSFTTIHDIPDEHAQEYIDMLRFRGMAYIDPEILKKGTQVIEAEAEFHKIGEPENAVKVPLITVIEAGILQ